MGCGSSYSKALAFLADLLPPTSLLPPPVGEHFYIINSQGWLSSLLFGSAGSTIAQDTWPSFYSFDLILFPLTCCRNSLSTPFTSREHLPAWIILPSTAPLSSLSLGTVLAATTTFSSLEDMEEVELPPRYLGGSQQSLWWGFSAEDNSLGYTAGGQGLG